MKEGHLQTLRPLLIHRAVKIAVSVLRVEILGWKMEHGTC
jgi:hypothetical protein